MEDFVKYCSTAIVLLVILCFILWKCYLKVSLHTQKGGYHGDITLPHSHPIELYFADISPTSMKVRMCLIQSGIDFKEHVVKLPSAGSWETKSESFLELNPAGTVPVLLHHGHPVYESNEQIKYIASALSPSGSKVFPSDTSERSLNEYWISQTNWCDDEMSSNIETALTTRPGNCVPILMLPFFVALTTKLRWKSVLQGFVIGGVNPKQIMLTLFWVFGVHVFRFVPMLSSLVKKGHAAMLGHLIELENLLEERGTTFIGGDDVVLADIAWAPLLDAMEISDWLPHMDASNYSHVLRYWDDLKQLHSFQKVREMVGLDRDLISNTTSQVKEWKINCCWVKNMYDS